MPKNELDRGAARRRVELVAAAEANVQAATAQLESALGNMLSTGIDHPVIEELRDTVTAGKRILARAREIARRLPLAIVVALLAACGDNVEPADQADAGTLELDAPTADARPVPTLDWSDWGAPCETGATGIPTCRSPAGVPGKCRPDLSATPTPDGLYPGACESFCFAQPPYAARCPVDGKVLDLGDQIGCTCIPL